MKTGLDSENLNVTQNPKSLIQPPHPVILNTPNIRLCATMGRYFMLGGWGVY